MVCFKIVKCVAWEFTLNFKRELALQGMLLSCKTFVIERVVLA